VSDALATVVIAARRGARDELPGLGEEQSCDNKCCSGRFQNDPFIFSGMQGAGEE
jgi:hypothetical protein